MACPHRCPHVSEKSGICRQVRILHGPLVEALVTSGGFARRGEREEVTTNVATSRERDEFERRVRKAQEAGIPGARETLAIATGLSEGCTERAPDVTLAEAFEAERPNMIAEPMRTMSRHTTSVALVSVGAIDPPIAVD
jgi:hypothetical protein